MRVACSMNAVSMHARVCAHLPYWARFLYLLSPWVAASPCINHDSHRPKFQRKVGAHDETINQYKYKWIPELEALQEQLTVSLVYVCVCVCARMYVRACGCFHAGVRP